MTAKTLLSAGLLTLATLACITACNGNPTANSATDAERGRYLVEKVGLCSDCHSPRDEKGQFVADRWLKGSPIPFQPTIPMPWAATSPQIAGLPNLTDEQAVHFLCTGELPGGRQLRAPMPSYRFSPEDARDVVAYLRAPIAPAQ
jgi:mono/diheme cytochrome c family protein